MDTGLGVVSVVSGRFWRWVEVEAHIKERRGS
jgi:hypothetical protein